MIDAFSNFSSITTANYVSDIRSVNDSERISSLKFHIVTGDYFRFHTTLLGFIEETLADGNSRESIAIQLEAIRSALKDLKYLDENYRIESRI